LAKQLQRSTEELSRELAAYEKKYGDMFVYKGQHYIEVLAADAQALEAEQGPVCCRTDLQRMRLTLFFVV